ncbi:KRAB-A domain-containing protein 2, partial [Trichinella murrelli]
LSPLKSKRAEEVASKLLEIFLTFGAPSILQSDNGQEFSYVIIAELKTCWPELKLVTGRPRHPQSQGAVERLNGVVQDKLAIWMRENGCKRWSMGLKFVQWQINVSIHETTGQSPFKVTFGEEPRIGLESY